MSDIQLKYEKLDFLSQKEVNDFIDFLLTKKDKNYFDLLSYKEKIKKITVWSDEDLKVFDENKKLFNNWNIEEW